jgi:ADP-heptose:LPS heptosyltransferase
MRLLITHPDTIGDLVLRQPMLAALAEAGHELMLLVRHSVEPLARQIVPGARVLTYPAEPYAIGPGESWEAFEPLFATVREFAPAAIVVAPFRWTLAEEQLSLRLPEVPCIGMSGNLYQGDPYAGAAPVSTMRLDQVAQVNENDLEVDKNAALTSVVLGHRVRLADPQLIPPPDALETARGLLAEAGMQSDEFWTACVGGTAHVAIKTWPAERWGAALSHWVEKYDRKFVFIGLPEESAVVANVLAAMGSAADHTIDLTPRNISLAVLQGLIALSRGYVGHDTGPMHIAAALNKPTLAVFGGGTWLRFLPAVTPSVAITVGVPCAGCGWVCPFDDSYCIKSVPIENVTQAIDDLEAGRVADRQSRVIEPPPALMARMTRQSVQAAEARLREAVEARKQLQSAQSQLAKSAAMADQYEPTPGTPAPVAAEAVTGAPTTKNTIAEVIAPLADRLALLEADIKRLQSQATFLQSATAAPAALMPRRPLRQLAVDLVVGKPYAAPRFSHPLPPVSIIVPAGDNLAALQAAIVSATEQDYHNLEVVIVDDLRHPEITAFLQTAGPRTRMLECKDATLIECICHGFESSYGLVLSFLRPGVTLAPGAIARVGELFRRRRYIKAAYFEAIACDATGPHPIGPDRRIDTLDFLTDEPIAYESLFFRREAYQMVGGLNASHGQTADWDLAIRLARMFGLARGIGTAAVRFGVHGDVHRPQALRDNRDEFLHNFGSAGRIRCGAIHRINGILNRVTRRKGPPRACIAEITPNAATAPPTVLAVPICPITRRPADRLLANVAGNKGPARIWYSSGGAAALYDPVSDVSAAGRIAESACVIEGLSLVGHSRAARGVIDLSCGDGAVLAAFGATVAGKSPGPLLGLEADPTLAAQARARGLEIIESPALDAPLVVADGQTFDLVVIGFELQRSVDPVVLLRRAKHLLSAGGQILITADNLDSYPLDGCGFDWSIWNTQGKRMTPGRRALNNLATAAGLHVRKLKTQTNRRKGGRTESGASGRIIHVLLSE